MIKTVLLITIASVIYSCPNDKKCGSCINNVCNLCYDSFFNITTKTCQNPTNKLDNCLRYDSLNNCIECQREYYQLNGKCAEVTYDCQIVEPTNPNICKVCDKGIQVIGGKCDYKNKCTLKECDFCAYDSINKVNICHECRRGFVLKNGVCEKEIDATRNCIHVDNLGNCDICRLNFYNSNGKCLKSDALNLR